MKAKDLAQLLEVIVRKVVREELKPIITEVRNASKPIIKETKSKPKTFVKNPLLNELLNETANDGEWRNMDAQFGSNQAQGFMTANSNTIAPAVDIDGRPVDTNNEEVANVMGAMTKDYSALMKAIDKKKGR